MPRKGQRGWKKNFNEEEKKKSAKSFSPRGIKGRKRKNQSNGWLGDRPGGKGITRYAGGQRDNGGRTKLSGGESKNGGRSCRQKTLGVARFGRGRRWVKGEPLSQEGNWSNQHRQPTWGKGRIRWRGRQKSPRSRKAIKDIRGGGGFN